MKRDLKHTLVLLPLDERPCNAVYPKKLFGDETLELRIPEVLGQKKTPACYEDITAFLDEACRDADGLVLSLEMLLYGGLIPSRIHHLNIEELEQRLSYIKTLKQRFPKLTIYALHCIMRCPTYSSSDEEPDYYATYGSLIHELGEARHKERLGLEPKRASSVVENEIDAAVIADYTERRRVNVEMNRQVLDLVEDGTVSFLVIPQDDSAPYSFAAMDQHDIRAEINRKNLASRVLMYPGADEVGLALLSRMLLRLNGDKAKVYVKYAADQARTMTPPYESNSLETTVKYHILSAGCRVADTAAEADIILALTAPAFKIDESYFQPSIKPSYIAERNMAECLDFVSDQIEAGKIVAICDNAYCNGGELQLIGLLHEMKILDKLDAYAGWNTSANSLGTTIAEAVNVYLYGRSDKQRKFLFERYLEDCAYDSLVRYRVSERLPEWGLDYFDLKDQADVIGEKVTKGIQAFISDYMPSFADEIVVSKVTFPWNRMFEIDLSIELR